MCKRSACVHLDLPQTEELYAKRSLWFEAETPVERRFGLVWKIKLKLTLQDRVEQDHPYYHHGKNKQNAILFFFFFLKLPGANEKLSMFNKYKYM